MSMLIPCSRLKWTHGCTINLVLQI